MKYYLKKFTIRYIATWLIAVALFAILAYLMPITTGLRHSFLILTLTIIINFSIVRLYSIREGDNWSLPHWRKKFILYSTIIIIIVQAIPVLVMEGYNIYVLHQLNSALQSLADPEKIQQILYLKVQFLEANQVIALVQQKNGALVLGIICVVVALLIYLVQYLCFSKNRFIKDAARYAAKLKKQR